VLKPHRQLCIYFGRKSDVALTVRAGGGAAVGVVTEGVDVHAALGVRVVAGDVPGDLGRGGLVSLLEGDGAGDLGVTADDADYPSSQRLVLCETVPNGGTEQPSRTSGPEASDGPSAV